jgi:hypothetical protein
MGTAVYDGPRPSSSHLSTLGSKCHDLSRVFVVQVMYGKQLHPDQLRAALGTTAPAPAAPVATAVGIGPTGTHHTQQQRIMVRRVTRRSVRIISVALYFLIKVFMQDILSTDLRLTHIYSIGMRLCSDRTPTQCRVALIHTYSTTTMPVLCQNT